MITMPKQIDVAPALFGCIVGWTLFGAPYRVGDNSHPMAQVFIGIGSNQGDRQAYLQLARDTLGRLASTKLVSWSNVYETDPVGPVPQPEFLNAVAELATKLSPVQLLNELVEIEIQSGRGGLRTRVKWGPRTLDLDILLYDNLVISEDDLVIPHPHMHERWFVLKPLSDLAPDIIHPLLGKKVRELLVNVEQEV